MAGLTVDGLADAIAAQLPDTWCGTDPRRMAELLLPVVAQARADALGEAVVDLCTAWDAFCQAFPEATDQARGIKRAGDWLARRATMAASGGKVVPIRRH